MSSDGDSYCPECGEPISATASYCMHCYADLPDGGVDSDPTEAGASGTYGSGGTGGDHPGEGSVADEVGNAADDFLGGDEDGQGQERARSDPTAPREASGSSAGSGHADDGPAGTGGDDQVLDPEGAVDNTLTIAVAIAGGLVVGFVATLGLTMVTGGNPYGFGLGLLVWLGSTIYLGRQYTVQGAIAKTGYAIAVVLFLLPLVAFSPLMTVEGGIGGRVETAGAIFVFSVFFGGAAAVFGRIAAVFAPEV